MNYLLKLANFYWKSGQGTNVTYTPKPAPVPDNVEITKDNPIKVNTNKENNLLKSILPSPGTYSDNMDWSAPLNYFGNSRPGTIGTGFGRRLWAYKDNPFKA